MSADLSTRIFVVTGASAGIGKVTALELARRGARVILACRSKDRAAAVIDLIQRDTGTDQVELVELDLGDLASVRACARALLDREIPIHGLVNNAGVAGVRGQTKDGFEIQFGTNHLGHYLLTRLLLDRMTASGPARIVNVASASHYQVKRIDWDALQHPTRSRTALREYAVSKLSNVLFTKELARRLDDTQVTTYAVHPGMVATDVWRHFPAPVRWMATKFLLTPEQGAEASVRCATAPELETETGRYYDVGGHERQPAPLADDPELARTLWRNSAEWTGLDP